VSLGVSTCIIRFLLLYKKNKRERERERKRERERERDVPKIEGGATPCRSTEVPILSNGRG